MRNSFGACLWKPVRRRHICFICEKSESCNNPAKLPEYIRACDETESASRHRDLSGGDYLGANMFIKTDGIILREVEYKDHDKLLTVLTKELGKVTVRARGAKSSRSRFKAVCQLLTYSELVLTERDGRYTLFEGTVIEMFPELRNDIEKLSLASYFAQVTDTVAQEEDPAPELLSLLLNALFLLGKGTKPAPLIKAVFELRLACEAGFLPDLRGCAVCGKVICDRINISQGILQCSQCNGREGIRMEVSPGTLEAMRYITRAPGKQVFSFQLSPESIQELNGITESYLCARLEKGFYTLNFYKSLFL